jgi:hypothetical protein
LRFLRSFNPEIAIGILLASVFWAAVLGWQAANAPSEVEKQKCYEAAEKAGHKSDECKTFWERTTADPLAIFTLVLAASTAGLWTATIGLYIAGERQIAHLKESSERQLRAYIHLGTTEVKDFGGPERPSFTLQYRNLGQTPASNVLSWSRVRVLDTPIAPEVFEEERAPVRIGDLGPGAKSFLVISGRRPISDEELSGVANGVKALIVFGRIQYEDVFGKKHTTRFRYKVSGKATLGGDKRLPLDCEGNEAD